MRLGAFGVGFEVRGLGLRGKDWGWGGFRVYRAQDLVQGLGYEVLGFSGWGLVFGVWRWRFGVRGLFGASGAQV